MKIISGGVCAAKGFQAGSTRCGIKASREADDLAIIVSESECTAAGNLHAQPREGCARFMSPWSIWRTAWHARSLPIPGNANACAPDGAEECPCAKRRRLPGFSASRKTA